jgi:hypothetical protein
MESSASEYVSMYVTGRTVNDPPGTLVPGTLVKAGNSYLYGYNRAGDYSGIGLDPADGKTFWAANEYKGNSFWNTYVASFQATPRPAEDWYRVTLPVDSMLRLVTTVPGSGPGEFVNNLYPHLELYDLAGNLLAAGTLLADGRNEQLAFAAHGGSYRIHVVGASNTFGEYYLNVASTPLAAGMLLLDASSKGALNVSGKGSLLVGGGGKIMVDSSNAAAAIDSGSGNVVATEIDVTGGTQTTGGGTFLGTVYTGVGPTLDPLVSLGSPTAPSTTYTAVNYSGSATLTLSPGTYNGGINISGQGPVTLMPGIYYMKGGGFIFSGQGTLTGYGVMIYNAPTSSKDVINLSGQGAVVLTAPTDGTYTGVTLFQDRASSNPVTLSGGSSLNITGTVYAAGAVINLSGNGGLVGSRLISKGLLDSGNGSFKINTNPQQLAAAGNASSSGAAVLINSAGDLLTGQVWVAVNGLAGNLAANEQARIGDAVAALNAALGPFGVNLVQMSGANAAWAAVQLYLADTSDIGGVDQGVLGVTENGAITIVTGWNYYLGADPAAIGSDQYDFQTVVTHELGHALGLGHSTDTGSVMYPYLASGDVRHDLTASDLKTIAAVEDSGPEPLRALPEAATDSVPVTKAIAKEPSPQTPTVAPATLNAALPPGDAREALPQPRSPSDMAFLVIPSAFEPGTAVSAGMSVATPSALVLAVVTAPGKLPDGAGPPVPTQSSFPGAGALRAIPASAWAQDDAEPLPYQGNPRGEEGPAGSPSSILDGRLADDDKVWLLGSRELNASPWDGADGMTLWTDSAGAPPMAPQQDSSALDPVAVDAALAALVGSAE